LNLILTPPLAILIYIFLVLVITWIGSKMAGPENPNKVKSSVYSSGELAPTSLAAPGYKPFFLIAFFFAILHLGMLVVGNGPVNLISGIFVVGLILALVALILG
jgi:NADH:ubiquinone oxidoreductase subunit 3 (subunit A)